ncbi:MAG: hypothetical protein IKO40_08230 [Kiritimatiellae bacterium]|nr:hypothetical protein [Kiritimatiellia bacterium]
MQVARGPEAQPDQPIDRGAEQRAGAWGPAGHGVCPHRPKAPDAVGAMRGRTLYGDAVAGSAAFRGLDGRDRLPCSCAKASWIVRNLRAAWLGRRATYDADIAFFKAGLKEYFLGPGAGHFRLEVTDESVLMHFFPGDATEPARTFDLTPGAPSSATHFFVR